MATIQEAVEKHLEGIITPDELYSDAKKIERAIIHEIAKVTVELTNNELLTLYDIEKYVYDEGSDTGFIIRSPRETYTIWYSRPYVEAITLEHNGRISKRSRVMIKEIKCYSKKDVTISELMNRYDTFDDRNVFDDTLDFQVKYGLMEKDNYIFQKPDFLPEENMLMKIGHLQEELDEIKKSYENRDLAETADRLMDLIYVAAGLCNLMRLPCSYLWNDVQNSNMAFKERVTSLENATKRGSTFDVRKTDKWIAPRGQEIIEQWRQMGEASERMSESLGRVQRDLLH